MTDEIRLRVFGTPAPKGSKSGFVNPRTGKVVITDGKGGKALRPWRKAVRIAAQQAAIDVGLAAPLTGPVSLSVVFWLPPPKSLSPRWRWLPTTKPDLDKLERATWDELSGVIYRDDSQIVDGSRRKLYAIPPRVPGALIVVRDLTVAEEVRGRAWRAGGDFPRLPPATVTRLR